MKSMAIRVYIIELKNSHNCAYTTKKKRREMPNSKIVILFIDNAEVTQPGMITPHMFGI